jgi:hypothetical protein
MTYQILEMSSSITEQTFDEITGKLISSVHSTTTRTKVVAPTSTVISISVLPVEYKGLVYKLFVSKKG